jgi:hypothetical protein
MKERVHFGVDIDKNNNTSKDRGIEERLLLCTKMKK